MKKLNWEEKRKGIREQALEEHARLYKLFKKSRLAFERERKRMIDEIIEGAGDKSQKDKLRSIQDSWDKKMKNAGSAHNRFVLAQHLFWDHVNNLWKPAMDKFHNSI